MADDYTDDTQTTGTVTVGGSATGSIESYRDRDWFAVALVAGRTYRFDLEGSDTRAGTLWDPYLRGIYDAGGNLLSGTTNGNGGSARNSRVTFEATDTATYYVSAGAFDAFEGTYKLSVRDVTDYLTDDFTARTDTTGRVAVGGSATGRIEFNDDGDRDWFAVRLVAGNIYRFDLEGSGTYPLSDPYLYGIYDASGNRSEGTTNNDGGSGRNSRVTFRATAHGIYYVSAGANGDQEGAYTLSVTNVTSGFSDDFTDGIGTTGTVTVGGSAATGDIDLAGDRDWFAVTLQADRVYQFNMEGTGTGALSNPTMYGIYDADGNRSDGVQNFSRSGGNNQLTFAATEGGRYYVSAGAYPDGEGTYTLSVREIPDDFTDGTGRTGMVAVGGSVTGNIDFWNDRDWFAVTLEMGKTYRFDLGSSQTNMVLNGIYNAEGNWIEGTWNDNGGSGNNSQVVFTAPAAATYYVSASGYGGARVGTYTLSVSDVTDGIPDDFTDGTGTAGAVTVGGSARGEIEFDGDRDWFAVTLDAGRTYRFDLEGTQTERGNLRDPYLRGIYDARGNLIEGTTDDDGGHSRNSRVTFRATASGTHYVSAGAVGDEGGTYRLSVVGDAAMDGVPDDFTAGTGTTGTATVGGWVTGDIEFWTDRDWFAVTLDAGTTYRFDLVGRNGAPGYLNDPYLRGIYDARGNLIEGTTDNDGGYGFSSLVTFTAPQSGTYYVSASAGSYQDNLGTYWLWVGDAMDGAPPANRPSYVPSDDFRADTGTPGRVTVGGFVTGNIQFYGDRDWFAVTLEEGKIYQFDLEGRGTSAGTLWDPYLYGIYDAEGNLIEGTRDNDGGTGYNSKGKFFAPADATYYVSAGADRGKVGTYWLSVREIADDFTDGIDTAGAVTVGDSATGEIQGIGDRDWFAVTLEMGKTYRFDLKGLSTRDGTLYDPYLRGIYDAAGSLVSGTTDDNDGFSLNSRVRFTAPADATYYVSAGRGNHYHHYQNLAIGTYTVSVRDITDDLSSDLTATTATTGTVTVGGTATGSIDFVDDRDWFAVTLETGKTYQFDLEGSGTDALYDPYLRGIYDADGAYISDTRNDDSGSGYNSLVTFTATADAVHYVSAGAYRESLGDYTLSVAEVL